MDRHDMLDMLEWCARLAGGDNFVVRLVDTGYLLRIEAFDKRPGQEAFEWTWAKVR